MPKSNIICFPQSCKDTKNRLALEERKLMSVIDEFGKRNFNNEDRKNKYNKMQPKQSFRFRRIHPIAEANGWFQRVGETEECTSAAITIQRIKLYSPIL